MGDEIARNRINIIKNHDLYDDFEVIFAILDRDSIKDSNEFDLIIDLLTQHSNPIREAVANKLEDYVPKYEEYFISDFALSKLLDEIGDKNTNVSRSVCKIISK